MRFLRNSYLVCISIHMLTSFGVGLFITRDHLLMPWYVKYDLVQSIIAACIYLSTDTYFLVLGMRL